MMGLIKMRRGEEVTRYLDNSFQDKIFAAGDKFIHIRQLKGSLMQKEIKVEDVNFGSGDHSTRNFVAPL